MKSEGLEDVMHNTHGAYTTSMTSDIAHLSVYSAGGILSPSVARSQPVAQLDEAVLFPEERGRISETASRKHGDSISSVLISEKSQGVDKPTQSTAIPYQTDDSLYLIGSVESEYVDDDFLSEASSHSSASVHDAEVFWGTKTKHAAARRAVEDGNDESKTPQIDRYGGIERPFPGDMNHYEDSGLGLDNTPVRGDRSRDHSSSYSGVAYNIEGLDSNSVQNNEGNTFIHIFARIVICIYIIYKFMASASVDRPWAHLKGYCVSNQDIFGATKHAIPAIERMLALYTTRKPELKWLLTALESLVSRRNQANAMRCRSTTLLSLVISSALTNLDSREAVSAACGVICNVLASNIPNDSKSSPYANTTTINSNNSNTSSSSYVSDLFGSERVCDVLVEALHR
jgi:hypothetical protein